MTRSSLQHPASSAPGVQFEPFSAGVRKSHSLPARAASSSACSAELTGSMEEKLSRSTRPLPSDPRCLGQRGTARQILTGRVGVLSAPSGPLSTSTGRCAQLMRPERVRKVRAFSTDDSSLTLRTSPVPVLAYQTVYSLSLRLGVISAAAWRLVSSTTVPLPAL